MELEPKDAIAFAALVVSLYNLLQVRLDKRNDRRLGFEQKRQELLSLLTERRALISTARDKAESLASECDRWLGSKSDLAVIIRGNVAAATGGYAFADVERLLAEYAEPGASTGRLVELERELGEARRKTQEARADAARIDQAVAGWRASFEKERTQRSGQ